jgi:drug/metabolite transporter (DMT)-like permease
MSYSLFFFLSGFLPSSLEPLAKSAVMAVAALAFLGALQGAGWSASAGSGDVPLAVWGLLLGLLGTALPTVCFNAAIPKIGPGLAALLGSMEIPAAMLFSYALLGESLSWQQGLGVAVILAGILAAQSRQEASAGLRPGSEE